MAISDVKIGTTTHDVQVKTVNQSTEQPLLVKDANASSTSSKLGVATTVKAGNNFIRIGSPTIAYDAKNKCLNFNF